ncbi:chemotaxis protein [Herbaspirillum lusitanum]|uniref:Chemotaxis protein n=1 Tax=Herbaspirillum lusitanum TaxID=213312 RepID=A0ABW9A8X3_9BURK
MLNLVLMASLAQHWWLGVLVGVLLGGAFYLNGALRIAGEAADAASPLPVPQSTAPVAVVVAGHEVQLSNVETAAPMMTGATSVAEGTSQHSTVVANEAQAQALPELMSGVLPAWRGNVQLARSQTQEAIDNLTARFAGLHDRLGGALKLSQGGKNADVLQVIQNAAMQLGAIAAALEDVLASRQGLLRKMDSLSHAHEEIRQLAQENEQLAGHTGVADLVSDERSWQEMAERSASNSRQIVAKSKAARQQIQAAISAASEIDSESGAVMDNSRTVIDQVVSDFRESALKLSGKVDQLQEENREVDQEICQILVSLQFQDRISQILDHVQSDISKLHEALDGGHSLPPRAQWLADLEQTYTTHEQRQMHSGRQSAPVLHSSVDFF